jgi:hypothetical protein
MDQLDTMTPMQDADTTMGPTDQSTNTAQSVVAEQNAPKPKPQDLDPKVKKRNDEFRQRIDICKLYRRKLIANWVINIDYRRGKPFSSQTDEDQVAVNLDWSLTKAKQAALFSQVPQIRLDHIPETLPKSAPWAIKFEHKLNDTMITAGVEAAMEECLPDCINAAGMGIVLVAYESIMEDRQVPAPQDPTAPPPDPSMPPPMETVPFPVDQRYTIQRISPADLLWPINFTGSNFDGCPWIGRSGRMTWASAVNQFNLKESDKDGILGEDRPMLDRLTHDIERDKVQADDMVGFDEIFFKVCEYDPEAKSFTTIHRLVYISGKTEPVVDEPWKGQHVLEDGTVIGAQKFPLRVLTLTYITDETVPPSDTAIGRPQVNEINKARTQMIRQRERSLPVRWVDVNRIDPAIMTGLMRGTWQAFIPVQGEGSRVIGEVARAAMPSENFMFDKIAKADLNEEWVMSPNAVPPTQEAPGDPNQNKTSFNTQVGRERARVGSFLTGIADVLGGLLCLYEDPSTFGPGFDPKISKVLKFSILTDSTVLLDSGQKLSRLNQFVNTYAKSGWINIEPVLQEIATLSGLDPTVVIKPPQPKPPVEPNISLRLTGVEDMLNPLALAFLIKSGQAPPPELIEQAKHLIQQAVVPPQPPPGQDPNMPGAGPGGGGSIAPPVLAPPPGTPLPSPPPPAIGQAHPQWTAMPQLNKRTE